MPEEINDTTKYVVSGTLAGAEAESTWRNSTVLGSYDAAKIAALKDEVGDLYVSGSGTLVRALLADGLVEVLNLCVFPTTRGAGSRLFPEGAPPARLKRKIADAYDNGVLYLAYRPYD